MSKVPPICGIADLFISSYAIHRNREDSLFAYTYHIAAVFDSAALKTFGTNSLPTCAPLHQG